jgi:hypothetical protein
VTSEDSKIFVEFSWYALRKYRHSISKFVTATANLGPLSTTPPKRAMDDEVSAFENFEIRLWGVPKLSGRIRILD